MYEGQAPSDAPVYALSGAKSILDLLFEAELVKSKGDARRLVQQGGVRVNGATVETVETMIGPVDGDLVIQAGKRKFLRVVAG